MCGASQDEWWSPVQQEICSSNIKVRPSSRTPDTGEYATVAELNEEYVQISRHDLLHILVTDTYTLAFQYIHLNFF